MIRLVVVNMMDRQPIAKFLFRGGAKLALVAIALADESLQRFGKSRSVLTVGDTAKPARITLPGKRLRYLQKPLFLGRALFTAPARRFAHLESTPL